MVFRGTVRAVGTALAVALLVFVGASPVTAQSFDCSVSVGPSVGAAGTVFSLRGSGFTPTRLVLEKKSTGSIERELSLGDAAPWSVSVASHEGDEGEWLARLSSESCSAAVHFTVTSPDSSQFAAGVTSSTPPTLAVLVILACALGGGIYLGRRNPSTSGG